MHEDIYPMIQNNCLNVKHVIILVMQKQILRFTLTQENIQKAALIYCTVCN